MAGMLSDLSPSMSSGWQSLDIATRAMKVALRSVDFQKTPAVVAVIQSQLNTLSELLSHYTSGTAGAVPKGVPSRGAVSGGDDSNSSSADADAQPTPVTDDDMSSMDDQS